MRYGKDTKHFLDPLGFVSKTPPGTTIWRPTFPHVHMSTSWHTFGISAPRHRCLATTFRLQSYVSIQRYPPLYVWIYFLRCAYSVFWKILSIFPKMFGEKWWWLIESVRKLPTKNLKKWIILSPPRPYDPIKPSHLWRFLPATSFTRGLLYSPNPIYLYQVAKITSQTAQVTSCVNNVASQRWQKVEIEGLPKPAADWQFETYGCFRK